MSRFPQQIIPLVVIIVAAMTALIVARQMLLPPSFGKLGHYRADAVGEVASLEKVYAGYQVCLDCHDDIYEEKQQSNHATVSCEACHGPAMAHTEDPDEVTPIVPSGRGFCPVCHGYDPARPTGFPQIIPVQHNPGQPCMDCHSPHSPELPYAPEDCSACHREIASEKLVSHHATLSCETCHTVPDEHLMNPAAVKAQKPDNKAVCGECHAEDADSARRIPRVDIDTHGERYFCWDCHYPHSPEAVQ
ncbi:MAG: hypothetical protein V3T31_04470 [candidate division Zixibacteria bacterium]